MRYQLTLRYCGSYLLPWNSSNLNKRSNCCKMILLSKYGSTSIWAVSVVEYFPRRRPVSNKYRNRFTAFVHSFPFSWKASAEGCWIEEVWCHQTSTTTFIEKWSWSINQPALSAYIPTHGSWIRHGLETNINIESPQRLVKVLYSYK